MFGLGVLRGMAVTLKHFVDSYIDDIGQFPRRYREDANAVHQLPHERGMFTVQYPEERLAVPERFRFLPFLLWDTEVDNIRCTSCGICAKVCPPQCIWIVRGTKPDGKPKPEPEEFYIDVSVCMSCGFCAEYCPFDAIKMDHVFELSDFERHDTLVYDLKDLTKTTDYYAETHPIAWAEEQAAKAAKGDKAAAAHAKAAR
jgi:NADH-quinone oxidoreductase subunit I